MFVVFSICVCMYTRSLTESTFSVQHFWSAATC